MRAEAIVTLIGVFLIVVALVLYLSIIAASLSKTQFALGTVVIGVRAIANQTQPLEGVVGSIARDVSAIDEALKDLVDAATAPEEEQQQNTSTQVTRRSRARASQ
jgi:cell shape-determining protein MreC